MRAVGRWHLPLEVLRPRLLPAIVLANFGAHAATQRPGWSEKRGMPPEDGRPPVGPTRPHIGQVGFKNVGCARKKFNLLLVSARNKRSVVTAEMSVSIND